jgi:HEAT repeat protein
LDSNSREPQLENIIKAVTEMAKGLKGVSFYPENHPSLNTILKKICQAIDEIPPPDDGIEITVSKSGLTIDEEKLPEKHDAITDLRNALFIRRTKKLIILPGVTPEEMMNFLDAITVDPDEILKSGGLERVLIGRKISKIWINKVDYDKLMEELKREEEHQVQEDEVIVIDKAPIEMDEKIEEEDIDTLLKALEQTAELAEYRDINQRILRKINELVKNQRLVYAEKTIKLYAHHIEYPPGGDQDIKEIATSGIIELADEDIIELYVRKFGSKSLQERMEAQTVLLVLGETGVGKILDALTEEKNLIVRKAMVDLVIKIGDPAIPIIVKYLNDDRWYVIRNMITILGGIGNEEVAPFIASTLQNPDPRVKKEALKALSKNPSPISITALGECCFDGDENIATIAITALGTKKEDKATQFLQKRFSTNRFIYHDYRISMEIIESLKKIGIDSAVLVLRNIATYNPLIKPKRMKELKSTAVQGIEKIRSEKAREVLEDLSKSSDTICRKEASKSLQRLGNGET